ncbi:hypothetical protein Ddc_18300 [Ditylenchus destructor]|nr:hypothetical protein Ddc_18300 [Ditylenchus destructor]
MLNAFLTGFSGMAGIAAALTFIGDHQQAIEWIRVNMRLPPRANHRAGHVFLLGLCLSASSISAILVMDTLGPERYIFPMDQPIYNWNGTVYQRALSLGVGIPVATMSFYYSALLVACIVIDILHSLMRDNNGNNGNNQNGGV